VVDFTTGAAVEGARIHMEENVVLTDATGAFAGSFLADGTGGVSLQVDAEGRCQLRVMLSAAEVARAEELLLRLPLGASVEGTVTDSSGAAISGVNVDVRVDVAAVVAARRERPAERSALGEFPSNWSFIDAAPNHAKTDAAGHFKIDGLVPLCRHRVISAARTDFRRAVLPLPVLGESGRSTVVDLRMER
jgi:hypothetical protein